MTNLTEQWEKGELPYAEYYIKLAGGEYTNDVWDIDGWQSFNKKGDVVVEVLAEVPSFEQWQAKLEENTKLKTENKWYSEQLNEAVKKIGQLKELLTMAREVLKMVDTYSGDYDSINGFLIVEKIDKVLGEE